MRYSPHALFQRIQMRSIQVVLLAALLPACFIYPASAQTAPLPPAPPAPPSPIEGKMIDCIAEYVARTFSKPGDAFELGTAVLKACKAQADAVVADKIQSQATVGGLRRTQDAEANNDNTKAAVYFQAQRYATMRIIQLRSEARATKGGL